MFNKTLNRLDSLLARINGHPEYSVHVKGKVINQLVQEASKHSLNIELLAETGEYAKSTERSRILQNLNSAWTYLDKYGISLSTLTVLGNIIEPDNNPYRNFRQTQTKFGSFYPPVSEVIPFEIKNLVDILSLNKIHPVQRAVEAHLEMVRIHPYVDGNGRAARLLQNFCLQQVNYPPAIILASERELYIKLLEGTLKKRYAHQSCIGAPALEESLFQEFIASKVLSSAEQLESELQKRRIYDLTLCSVDNPSTVRILSRNIRDYAKADHRGVSVVKDKERRCQKGAVCLKVIGDISKEELDLILDRKSTASKIKYHLVSVA